MADSKMQVSETAPLVPAVKKPVQREVIPWALIGFRGCLALLVIFDHSIGQLPPGYNMVKVYRYDMANRMFCHRAIVNFFIMSAYQLTLKFLRECPAPDLAPWRTMVLMWGKYGLRRFFRIYPAFTAAMVMLLVIQPLNACYWDIDVLSLRSLWGKLSLTDQVGGIFWTIPPEMQFYCVMPVFVMVYKAAESADHLISKQSKGTADSRSLVQQTLNCGCRILALIPGCLTAFRMRLTPFGPNDICVLDPYLICFYLGSLMAVCEYNLQKYVAEKEPGVTPYEYLLSKVEQTRLVWWAVRIGVTLLTWLAFMVSFDLFSLFSTINEGGGITYYVPRPPDSVYVCWCALLVLLGGACPEYLPGSWASFMTTKPILFAGNISYSIYLCHPLALCFVRHFVSPSLPIRVPILYGLGVALAYLGHRFVEQPGILAGNKVAKKFETWMKSAPPPAPVLPA